MGDQDTISAEDFPKKKEPLPRIADHDYFVIPGITDVDKIREQAHLKSQGDSYAKPESTMVHHHRIGEECRYGDQLNSSGEMNIQQHEWYPAKED